MCLFAVREDMVSAVQFLISKLLSPLWSTVEGEEEDGFYYSTSKSGLLKNTPVHRPHYNTFI